MSDISESDVQLEIDQFVALLRPFLAGNSVGSASGEARVCGTFGLRPREMAVLWLRMVALQFVDVTRQHALWALQWLRTYATEAACVSMWQPRPPTEKTYREHVRKVVDYFSRLGWVWSPVTLTPVARF